MAEAVASFDTSKNSMDALLAPSMDEHAGTSLGVPPVGEDERVQRLQQDIKAVRSALKHSKISQDEKKVEDPTDDFDIDLEEDELNSSFEMALDQIENEFDAEFGGSGEVKSPKQDKDVSGAEPPRHKNALGVNPSKDLEMSRSASSLGSDGTGIATSTFESSRYNNILGLLRNRREELAAALQKQPAPAQPLEQTSSEETTGEKDVVVQVNTKGSDTFVEPSTPKHLDLDPTMTGDDEVKSAVFSQESAKSPTSPGKTKDAPKLERIESVENVEESRRRQGTASPRQSNPADPNTLSPTPPRSPKRSLPYFHKPSGTTPPASPSFVADTNNSPKTNGSLETSPMIQPKTSPSQRRGNTSPSRARSEETSRDVPKLPSLLASRMPERVQDPGKLRASSSPPRSPRSSESRSSKVAPQPFDSPSRTPDAGSGMSRTPVRKTISIRTGKSGKPSPKKSIPPDKIRFRDPYPILRPEKQPRNPKEIVADHSVPREQSPIRWVRPKPDLKQLIVAAMGPSLPRRSNACGALKVLTMNKKNQINLFRTDSFMSSMIFCASQNIPVQERDVALDTRSRALTCLRNVCQPRINRYHIVTFPGLLDCVAKAIETDAGESRSLACGALAFIAKTSECREEIVKDFRLVKLLAHVMADRAPVVAQPTVQKEEVSPSPPVAHDVSEHTEEDEESEPATPNESKEDSMEDYESAFAGSLSLLESFDVLSGAKSFEMLSGGQGPVHDSDGEEEASVDEASYESEPDQPAVDSIRKKNLERSQTFVQESRASACAILLHLSRECGLSMALCNNRAVLENMLIVANEMSNPIHTRCLEFLFNLTRFPANNAILTPFDGFVASLLSLGSSDTQEDRLLALQTLQNLSSDQSSKSKLAVEPVLTFLTACAVRKDDSEREAAVSAMQNISTEPGAVVAITNTKNAVATLVHLAHSPSTKQNTRQLACETLANISLWLQTLAGTGKVPTGVENTLLPTLKTSGWKKWD